MKILGLLAVTAMLGALELPLLLRQQDWRGVAAVIVILLLGLGFAMALVLDLPVPTVAEVIRWTIPPLVKID